MSEPDQAPRQRARRLAWLIIIWDVIEGAVAVTAGLAAGSIALLSFGIDSVIEVFAAAVIVWQLRAGPHARQRPALRLIAVSFLALTVYVTYRSISDLIGGERPDASPVGIGLNVVALAVMIPVAVAQRRAGRQLGNEAVLAQAKETWVSNYLSVSLLAGLGLNAAFGWWWADPAAALVVAAVAGKAGVDAWRDSNGSGR
ncbi:cation transporter [Micromonospora sp. HM5-17]|uniref:cation transporter n=1 Tax=Micromonospora sp. HM5-17 TaxID=2487710 RepID=UPI000F47DEA7|nr:cation transporter [Micromonospora sp. HM5-17]ROT33457.1 cation transporter [Micromonospora sp. HM5-17]